MKPTLNYPKQMSNPITIQFEEVSEEVKHILSNVTFDGIFRISTLTFVKGSKNKT